VGRTEKIRQSRPGRTYRVSKGSFLGQTTRLGQRLRAVFRPRGLSDANTSYHHRPRCGYGQILPQRPSRAVHSVSTSARPSAVWYATFFQMPSLRRTAFMWCESFCIILSNRLGIWPRKRLCAGELADGYACKQKAIPPLKRSAFRRHLKTIRFCGLCTSKCMHCADCSTKSIKPSRRAKD
jgi:hypothetical protein